MYNMSKNKSASSASKTRSNRPKNNNNTTLRKSKPRKNRVSNASKLGNAYFRLLCDPFDNSAFGAKVSDPQSKYTDTYKIHSEFKVVAPSGTTTAAYILKPNPFLSVIDAQSWAGGISTSSAAGWNQYTQNTYFWGATTPATLAATMTNYRIVSHGVRIRLEIPQQYVTGRMIITRAPRSRRDPPSSTLANCNFTAGSQTLANYPITSYPLAVANSPYLLETPESMEFSMINLIGNDLLVVNRPNAMSAFEFSQLGNGVAINATQALAPGPEVITIATSATAQYTFDDNTAGWDDIYIYFDGLPNTAAPIVNFEIIYHLEGTPAITSTTAIGAIPSHPPSQGSDFIGFDNILGNLQNVASYIFTSAPTAYKKATGRNLLDDATLMARMSSQRNFVAIEDYR